MIAAATDASKSLVTPSQSLAPALITASVAILLFAANQWVLFLTKRSEILREKLERLWQSLLVVQRQTRPITAYGKEMNEEIARNLHERAHLLIESLLEPTTFIALYFPALNFRYSRITEACGELVNVMRKPPLPEPGGGPEGSPSLVATYHAMLKKPGFFMELSAASAKAKKEVEDLQVFMREDQTKLTKNPWQVIAQKWSELSDPIVPNQNFNEPH